MAADSEDYMTFALRFEAFKWKVLPSGLTGGPASWQQFINDVLWEYLNKFCTAYLDDILIYSNNLKEHKEYVRLVLAKWREFGIQADVDKCEFHVTETKYLRTRSSLVCRILQLSLRRIFRSHGLSNAKRHFKS